MKPDTLRLVYEPKVYLVGRQSFDDEEFANFLTKEKGIDAEEYYKTALTEGTESEILCEIAGRTCYQSFGGRRKTNKEYLAHIIESGHGSITEHAIWGFLITGVSRSLTHQLIRYRVGISPSMLSERYVDHSEAQFVVPIELMDEVRNAVDYLDQHISLIRSTELAAVEEVIEKSKDSLPDPGHGVYMGLRWLRNLYRSIQDYKDLVSYLTERIEEEEYAIYASQAKNDFTKNGWLKDLVSREQKTEFRKSARQTARSILPECTETKIYITGNARALRHAIESRCSLGADSEIRRLFNTIYFRLKDESPNLFGDYYQELLDDGTWEITTKNRKI